MWQGKGVVRDSMRGASVASTTCMNPDLARAFLGGVAGTIAMMAASTAARSGVMSELTRLAGSMTSAPESRATQPVGVAAQLVNGGLFAVGYATAFRRFEQDLDWRTGAAVGLAHGLAAGVFLRMVPALHPRVPEDLPAPGAFMLNRGRGAALTLIGLHVLFGAIVGAASAGGAGSMRARARGLTRG